MSNNPRIVQQVARNLQHELDKECQFDLKYTTAQRIVSNMDYDFVKRSETPVQNKAQDQASDPRRKSPILGLGMGGYVTWDVNKDSHMFIKVKNPLNGPNVVVKNLIKTLEELGQPIMLLDVFQNYLTRRSSTLKVTASTDINDIMKHVEQVMMNRYTEMEENQYSSSLDLPSKEFPNIFVIVNDVDELMSSMNYYDSSAKIFVNYLSSMIRLGRSAGVHVVLIGQSGKKPNVPADILSGISLFLDENGPVAEGKSISKDSEFYWMHRYGYYQPLQVAVNPDQKWDLTSMTEIPSFDPAPFS